MEEIKLDVQVRKEKGTRKIKSIRRRNFVPAVVYGEQKDPTPIQVERSSFERIMRHHKGQSVLFHLNVLEGEKKLRDYSAILKEEQHHPVSDILIHIDFLRISLTKEIEVKVPLIAKGSAIGIKEGGLLEQTLRELDIICLPKSIPEKIEIDVTSLKIGDAIHLSDIKLPAGVKTKHDLTAIVVTVVPPMKEEIEAPEEGAPTEPEVLKEKKKEEAAGDKKEEKKDEKK